MTIFRDGSITLQGGTVLAYGECGTGKPVLLLHGNPGSHADWEGCAKLLSARGFRCVAVDRPGHGNSGTVGSDPGAAAAAYASLLRHLGGQKALIVGYSMGAHFALDLAERHSDLVSGLALVAPYLVPRDAAEKPSGLPGLLETPVIGSLLGLALPFLAGGKIRSHIEATFRPAVPAAGLVERLTAECSGVNALKGMFRDKNLFLERCGTVNAAIGRISCPVLLVTGAGDEVSGTASAGLVGSALPAVKRSDVAGGGHALIWSHAGEVAEAIFTLFS
ncbi:MAG TPA: alpha/beta hydrolase [Candidatus Ozemobacteraceae bacterium]|nr:alpha/beta hydrolase [Candidatus Ozemobacteraceae bacterium]